ncbi:MAG: hypothetical protein K1Y01_20320 [Vicinamibacteria bacterium]|nr:hypothetical protein [Vicinamibacteria bacterium]
MKGLILVSDAAHSASVLGVEGLRPLLGRPFVVHVLEQLVLKGITDIDVVLDTPRPLDYERALGTGERHGASIRYHLVRDPGRPGSRLRRFRGPVLLALAHRLVNVAQILDSNDAPERPIVWCSSIASSTRWSGWAALPEAALADIPESITLNELAERFLLMGEEDGLLSAARPLLAADDAALLLRAQGVAFHADFLQLRGETLPGDIRVGRGVRIDPSARLIGPVFLGDQSRIGAGAVIGPHAYIGGGAMVGRNTVLRDAVVTRRTSVGERLDIESAIVSGAGIARAAGALEIRVTDPFILSPLSRPPVDVRGLSQRAVAAGLFVGGVPLTLLALPWLAATGYRLRAEPVPGSRTGERTWRLRRHASAMAAPDRPSLRDFLTRVVPSLPSVVLGRVALAGREAARLESPEAMPAGWRERLQSLRPGVISAAVVDGDPTPLVRHLSDLTFGAAPSVRADLKLVLRYFVEAARRRAARALPAQDAAWAMAAAARIRN